MRLGVLFLNLGGPEQQEDVEGFLYNLFAGTSLTLTLTLPPFTRTLALGPRTAILTSRTLSSLILD